MTPALTRAGERRLQHYVALVGGLLVAALAGSLPELAAVAAPFALLVGVALAGDQEPVVTAHVRLDRDRVLEGEDVVLTLDVGAQSPVARLEVLVVIPDGLSARGSENPVAIKLDHGDQRELRYSLRCERWGAYRVGALRLRARDRLQLLQYEDVVDATVALRVYPKPEFMRSVLQPLETQLLAGDHVSRSKGEGIEFADLRPFVPGDRIRRVNWRATARRGELWVNEDHPERNSDVVLFLDAFGEAAAERETMVRGVRAAAALADHYLARKDRVGLVTFGGALRWLQPGSGVAYLYRIIDALVDTRMLVSHAWADIDLVPPRTLPPNATVIALTPLLDERTTVALLDLRRRGFDLVIVELAPLALARRRQDAAGHAAWQLWELKRDALRGEYQRLGVPVAVWHGDTAFATALEEVIQSRRDARRLHA